MEPYIKTAFSVSGNNVHNLFINANRKGITIPVNFENRKKFNFDDKENLEFLSSLLSEWKEKYDCKEFDRIFRYPCEFKCSQNHAEVHLCRAERDDLIDSEIRSLQEKISTIDFEISIFHPSTLESTYFTPILYESLEPSKQPTFQNHKT